MITIVGIDGDSIVYTVGYASQRILIDKLGNQILKIDSEESVIRGVDRIINKILYFSNADSYSLHIGGPKNYREDIATIWKYKANRDRSKRPEMYTFIRNYLMNQYNARVSQNCEADDCLGIEATNCDDNRYIICSTDKDLDMIPGIHYNWKKDLIYDVTEEEAIKFFYLQLLSGDTADNIPSLYHLVKEKHGQKEAYKVSYGRYLYNAKIAFKELKTEKELWEYVLGTYLKYEIEVEKLIELGQLLWIQRKEEDLWTPPK